MEKIDVIFDNKEEMFKQIVRAIRKLKIKYGTSNICVDFNSTTIEYHLYYHNIIKKLTGVNLMYIINGEIYIKEG